jgi:hypothetical protein
MTDLNKTEQEPLSGLSDFTVKLGGFYWKPATGILASGHVCYAGKWEIGSVGYVSGSKSDVYHQGAFMKLPGLKERLGVFETEEEARKRVEQAGLHWFKNLHTPNAPAKGRAESASSN